LPRVYEKLRDIFKYNNFVRRKIRGARILSPVPTAENLDGYDPNLLKITGDVISSYIRNIQSIGQMNRLARYADYTEMETYPEIGSALDLYTDECMTPNEDGDIFIISSKDKRIQGILEELFFDILNFKINLAVWLRIALKYGDNYLFLNLTDKGIIDAFPLPINEIERVDDYEDGRFTVRYRWLSANTTLENFQIVNFRFLGKEIYFPYGTSIIENARRVWRQLTLMEDMMLSYRMVRSSERRVFYIDVGNVAPDKVTAYINKIKASIKQNKITDPSSGRNDLRYDPLDVETDYFIPVRGNKSGTRIDTLPGASNITHIDDIKYLQSKLFSALKIPKSYLGYEEDVNAKNTLIQEDVRFARTISKLQNQFIADCNKLAIIQLYLRGVPEDKLLDFELKLPLSSTAYELQKLNLWSARANVLNSFDLETYPIDWTLTEVINISEKKFLKFKEYLKKREQERQKTEAKESSKSEETTGTATEIFEEKPVEEEFEEFDNNVEYVDRSIVEPKSIFSSKYNATKKESIGNAKVELFDGCVLDSQEVKRFLSEYVVSEPDKVNIINENLEKKMHSQMYLSKTALKETLINDIKKASN